MFTHASVRLLHALSPRDPTIDLRTCRRSCGRWCRTHAPKRACCGQRHWSTGPASTGRRASAPGARRRPSPSKAAVIVGYPGPRQRARSSVTTNREAGDQSRTDPEATGSWQNRRDGFLDTAAAIFADSPGDESRGDLFQFGEVERYPNFGGVPREPRGLKEARLPFANVSRARGQGRAAHMMLSLAAPVARREYERYRNLS